MPYRQALAPPVRKVHWLRKSMLATPPARKRSVPSSAELGGPRGCTPKAFGEQNANEPIANDLDATKVDSSVPYASELDVASPSPGAAIAPDPDRAELETELGKLGAVLLPILMIG